MHWIIVIPLQIFRNAVWQDYNLEIWLDVSGYKSTLIGSSFLTTAFLNVYDYSITSFFVLKSWERNTRILFTLPQAPKLLRSEMHAKGLGKEPLQNNSRGNFRLTDLLQHNELSVTSLKCGQPRKLATASINFVHSMLSISADSWNPLVSDSLCRRTKPLWAQMSVSSFPIPFYRNRFGPK